MRIYQYTGKSKDGEHLSGEIEAENPSAAARVLAAKNIIPISIEEGAKQELSFFNRIGLKDKVVIMRQLATMIAAGLPISQSLKTLEEQTTTKAIKTVMGEVVSNVEGGSRLSDSLAHFPKVFSQYDIAIISAGEESGNLDTSLKRLADQLEKEQTLLRKVRGAFVYPVALLIITFIFVIAMSIYVMPQMEGLYASFNKSLPLPTLIMIGFSHFVIRFWYLVLALLVGTIIAVAYYLKTPAGKRLWDGIKIELPAVKVLMIKLYSARLTRTLSGLISSGVAVQDALIITSRAVNNVHYEDAIAEIAEKVKGGGALSDALRDPSLFPVIVPQMVSVGEKTGELDQMLVNLANYFDEEVDNAVKNITELIMPFMIVLIGILIGVVMVSTLMPIYSLGGKL